MQWNIKTLIRKLLRHWKFPSLLYPKNDPIFPERGISKFQIFARLRGTKNELRERKITYNLGSLYSLPHPLAVNVYQDLLEQNPNHLGNWSDTPSHYATYQLEYDVIRSLIHLYGGESKNLEGYITTGGTEGNIFSTWVGRKFLEQFCDPKNIALLKTELTHYSVRKAGDICGVAQYNLPLDYVRWNISVEGLQKLIELLYAKRYRGFLLPLTIGYTATGTSDDVDLITRTVSRLQKKYRSAHFFLWIDAALSGLILPFVTDFTPFRSSTIQTCFVDFHKFGQIPYPAGIILYRKGLRKLIDQPIDYLAKTDSTLLGSRTGIPAASIWAMIQYFGRTHYKRIVLTQMKNKNFFIGELKRISPDVEIITHHYSLSCGIIFHSLKNQRLPKNIEDKYWLYPAKMCLNFHSLRKKEVVIYKMFFLPHTQKRVLKELISDVKTRFT